MAATMTKTALVRQMAEKLEITNKQAAAFLDLRSEVTPAAWKKKKQGGRLDGSNNDEDRTGSPDGGETGNHEQAGSGVSGFEIGSNSGGLEEEKTRRKTRWQQQ